MIRSPCGLSSKSGRPESMHIRDVSDFSTHGVMCLGIAVVPYYPLHPLYSRIYQHHYLIVLFIMIHPAQVEQ